MPAPIWLLEIDYILNGLVGGFVWLLLNIYEERFEKLKPWRILAHLGLSAIAGYICFILVYRGLIADHLTAIAFGYVAPDVLRRYLKVRELRSVSSTASTK